MTLQLSTVELDRHDRIAIATVSGEVDLSNAATVRQRIAAFVTPDDEALLVDLTSVSFIDSAGLHALFDLEATLGERRQQFRLVVPSEGQVARTIGLIGMPRTIEVHPDRSAAEAAVRTSSQTSRPVTPDTPI